MEPRDSRVTPEAELTDVLMAQQVSVHVSVRRSMAGRAAFHSIAEMREHKGPVFVRMALDADVVLEAPQLRAGSPTMLAMAIDTLHHAFIDPMPLVEVD
jgi:hypothetical protein